MANVIATLIVLALVVGIALVWRWASWPCPAWLVPLLENSYVEAIAGAKTVLERAGIRPGMRVLDAGCGPGRLTLPASIMVGPSGQVVAVDIQRRMLDMLRDRVAKKGLTNVELVLAGLGEGRLAVKGFDIALLVTVLGEIPDKLAACERFINVFGRAVFSRSRKCFPTRIISSCRASAGSWQTPASTNWRSFGDAYPTRLRSPSLHSQERPNNHVVRSLFACLVVKGPKTRSVAEHPRIKNELTR